MKERAFGGFGHSLDKGYDGVDDGSFEFESSLLAEKVGEEPDEYSMLRGVGEAQTLEGFDNGNLVFVGDFRKEYGDLLE